MSIRPVEPGRVADYPGNRAPTRGVWSTGVVVPGAMDGIWGRVVGSPVGDCSMGSQDGEQLAKQADQDEIG